MNPAASSRPCIDSAASCRAAIHPSVRPSSAATSAAVSSQAHHLVEVRRSLVRREPQVGGTDLDQLATRSQPGQRQRRVSSAGDHQVQPRRQVVEQERHRVLDLAGVDQVVVVEHQHDVAAGRAEVVEQRREHHLDRGRLRRGQQLQLVRRRPRAPPSAAPRPGSSRRSPGSLSPESSANHAAGPSPADADVPASHSASNLDLPKPAGAETRVSFDAAPRSSCSFSRGRGTRPGRGPGR